MTNAATTTPGVSAWLLRAGLLAGAWLVIAGGDPASLVIGVPAIALATWASLRITRSGAAALSPTGAVQFAAFFLRESLRGGIDVARRTLAPAMNIAPGFITYPCALPQGRPRVLFANCVSLLPGTLAVEMRAQDMVVHVLDTRGSASEEMRHLEQVIARLFTLTPETGHA